MIGQGVQVTVTPANEVIVKGAKASQTVKMRPQIKAKVEGNQVILTRTDEERESAALHGLYRALIQNAVTGVQGGFQKSLELVGVGYRANVAGKKLELSLGFSHPVVFAVPEGIEIKVDKQTIIHISGADKAQVGQVAAKIRGFKPPEPFLGKGVKYVNEHIRRKAGKAGAK
jgi:large subunit ribosomal protein L6